MLAAHGAGNPRKADRGPAEESDEIQPRPDPHGIVEGDTETGKAKINRYMAVEGRGRVRTLLLKPDRVLEMIGPVFWAFEAALLSSSKAHPTRWQARRRGSRFKELPRRDVNLSLFVAAL